MSTADPTRRPIPAARERASARKLAVPGVRPGVNLLEILCVIAVLAVLAAIALPNMMEARARSHTSRAIADLRTQRLGIEAYAADHTHFPRMTHGDPPFNDLYEGKGSPLQPVYGTLGPWLTTPVAYLAEFDTIDPFGRSSSLAADARMYTYQDLGTRQRLGMTGPIFVFPPYENEFFERYFGAFAQMSIGPDGTVEPFYTQYDPTNGTFSAGNIWVSHRAQDREGQQLAL